MTPNKTDSGNGSNGICRVIACSGTFSANISTWEPAATHQVMSSR